jgi:prophage regulatory protein
LAAIAAIEFRLRPKAFDGGLQKMADIVRILRKPEVLERLSISKSTLHTLINQGKFAMPVRLSKRRVGWIEREVDEWLEKRSTERAA